MQGLTPESYRHPADQAATSALQRIPHFETLMRRLLGLGIARRERNLRLGSSVRLGPDQLPRIWELHVKATSALGIDQVPDLYMLNSPDLNAYTIGVKEPIVVIHSRLVEVFDETFLEVVLAHEAGHIHCDHFLYNSMLDVLFDLLSLKQTPLLAGLPLRALALALLSWQRAAEMSGDRAAGVVTGAPRAVCATLLGLAGGTAVNDLNLDAFIRQGREFDQPDHPLDLVYRLFDRISNDHPLAVRRVGEFMAWVDNGHLDRILGGDFSVSGSIDARAQPSATVFQAVPSAKPSPLTQTRAQPTARVGSQFDRLARDHIARQGGADAEEAGMTMDEIGARIENWLARVEE
jgi:Zn-dependent protease with chaperone function